MTRTFYLLWLTFTIFLTAASPNLNLPLQIEDAPIPPGFYLIDASIGWEMYRKDYKEGNPDFVQIIRLDEGAGIELITSEIAKSGTDRGSYGGDNPKFFSRALDDYWWDISNKNPDAVCVTNGSFFYLPEHPTKLAFPLKVDNQILTDGFGIETYPWQKLILELWDGRAQIRRLTRWNLHTSNAPDIIGGLAEDANKKAKNYTGRTFIGIDDRDSDGDNETVLIFNTLTARQVDAADTLYSFGADKVMMLDGGGSTQLLCKGEEIVESERLIPQVLAITRGEGLLYSGRILNPPEHPILVEGEKISTEITIENNGAESWRPDNGYLMLDYGSGASKQKIPFDRMIFTGEEVDISWNFDPGNFRGDTKLNFYLIQGPQKYHIEPADIPIILLPRKSGINVKELASNLDLIINPKVKPTESFSKSIDQSAGLYEPAVNSISPEQAPEGDLDESGPSTPVILIPLSIIVISGVIMAGIKRRNSKF